jgi:nucleoside-diphosphate-sugar epimerase
MNSVGNVLVTGAAGFLGSHVMRAFHGAGWPAVAGLRKESDPWRIADLEDVQRVYLDLNDFNSISTALASAESTLVVHCAAYGVDYREQDLDKALAINVDASLHLFTEATRMGVKRFIHVGTAYEYGPSDQPIGEASPLMPRGIYGTSKAAAAQAMIAVAAKQENAPGLCIVRPFPFYGPYEGSHKFVPMLLQACRDEKTVALTEGGQIRDYSFVGDIAHGIMQLTLMEPFPNGEIVNLACGKQRSLRRIGEAAQRVAGGGGHLDWGAKPYRDDDIMTLLADVSKATRLLGQRSITPLDEGLRQTFSELEKRQVQSKRNEAL